jgi:hypothetical protein
MDIYWLILGILCVWRITHLLNAEDGPWDLIVRFRNWVGEGFWGELLDCFYCLSVWIALPMAGLIGQEWMERLVLWPALSAGAILLEGLTDREEAVPPALYIEEPEDQSVLLWQEEETGAGNRTKQADP